MRSSKARKRLKKGIELGVVLDPTKTKLAPIGILPKTFKSKLTKNWLKTLPCSIRKKALREFRRQNFSRYNMERRQSLSDAINGDITWSNSRQGRQFWSDIYDTQRELERANEITDG